METEKVGSGLLRSAIDGYPDGIVVFSADGRVALDRKPAALGLLLAEAVEARRALAAEKGIVIRERLPEKPLNLSLDRERAAQAITAFLDNAVQRTGDNGSVEVVAEERPAHVWIGFRDAGPVLSPGEGRLTFDRDHQILTERRLGRGFALSVAKAVAVAHGGTAGVENRTDGATFFLTFPR
jgi:signal transduction histidine kinase